MLYKIENLLTKEQLKQALDTLASGTFQDGKLTAGADAQKVKNNLELDPNSTQSFIPLNKMIRNALNSNPYFVEHAMPKCVVRPLYARYTKGMGYGAHVDNAYMAFGPSGHTRTDVSTTIFLSNAEDYEGGELVISTPFGDQKVKLNAGDAVFYPSSSLHHVAEVTSGERLVAVTWSESLVRDPIQRQMLAELSSSCKRLLKDSPDSEDLKTIQNVQYNLFRMWCGDL